MGPIETITVVTAEVEVAEGGSTVARLWQHRGEWYGDKSEIKLPEWDASLRMRWWRYDSAGDVAVSRSLQFLAATPESGPLRIS